MHGRGIGSGLVYYCSCILSKDSTFGPLEPFQPFECKSAPSVRVKVRELGLF